MQKNHTQRIVSIFQMWAIESARNKDGYAAQQSHHRTYRIGVFAIIRWRRKASNVPGNSNALKLFFAPPLFRHPTDLGIITWQTILRVVFAHGEHFVPGKVALRRTRNTTVDRRIDRWRRDIQGRTIQIVLGSPYGKDRQRKPNKEHRKNREHRMDTKHKGPFKVHA
jgi:hypothetical protein